MKVFGYIVGFLLLANGVMTAMSPRWWTDTTVHATEKVSPRAGFLEDFTRISPQALRFGGIWETALGLTVIALASRIRSRGRISG